MSVFSKISPYQRNTLLLAAGLAGTYWVSLKVTKARTKRIEKSGYAIALDKKDAKKEKAAVDMVFFRKLSKILKILIPGWFSAETFYLLVVALSLIARTYADVWMIQNGTAIESSIIGRSNENFKKHLFRLVYAMPLISIVNNCLKSGLSELKLRFRERLTRYLYAKYLKGFTYYKMTNLDNRIANADQLLTQDVERFCDGLADLYSNLSKPLLDIGIYAKKLTSSIGAQGPGTLLLYLVLSGTFLTRLRRPIAQMTITEQRHEGEFRYVNSRLITNSEEIAFYQGNEREKQTIMSSFSRLVNHLRNFIIFRFSMGFIDNIVAKYVATIVGYLVVSRPFLNLLHPRHMTSNHTEMMEDYYTSGRMLVKMAEAIGRVVLAGREMTRLAGFTSRVTTLMQVLDDLNVGKYTRTMVGDKSASTEVFVPGSGKIIEQDYVIKFDRVPLVTPNGDLLIRELTLEVKSGVNVLVCGPNGCGKSSLFRTLGELWPLFGGTLTKPNKNKLFYIPQRPYMTLGTFRDQIIYPDAPEDMKRKKKTDADLAKFLSEVQLPYLLEREGGWDSVQDWMDVLSGGEKQRVAMARLFYHQPQFAILDECTSAVSVDVEGFMYQYCKEVGITLFTVSHRKSLWKYHEYVLSMDGRGKYEFKPIEGDTVEFGS